MKPPRMATWLLRRFVPNDALVGDLAEEFRRGRSGAWYWRQALIAIVVASYQDIRAHKLLAVRAVVTGWVSLILFGYLAVQALLALKFFWISDLKWSWSGDYELYLLLFIACCYSAASGWIVGRLHRAHRMPMVFIYLTSVLLWSVCTFPLNYWFVPPAFAFILRHLPFLLTLEFIGVPVSVLVGGLLSAPREADLYSAE